MVPSLHTKYKAINSFKMRNKAILILYLTPIFTKILDKQIALASQESQKLNLRN